MDLGFRIQYFLSGDHRDWKYLWAFSGSDVHNVYDHVADTNYAIDDDRRILAGLRKLPNFSGQPNFFYFFLKSAHAAGTKLPEYERYRPAKFDDFGSFWNEVAGTQRLDGNVSQGESFKPHELAALSNRYDNGVLQADSMIAQIFSLLEEKGYMKDSLAVILGDHGDGLGEHGHFGHSRYLFQEDMHIPLLIYDRDISMYHERRYATQIDVAPTVVDRLGLPIPSSWQGTSLLKKHQERVTLHQTRRGKNLCRAVVSHDSATLFKYIRCGIEGSNPTEELFEIYSDPGERKNLIDTVQVKLLDRLRQEIDSRFIITTNRCQRFSCVD